MLHIISNAAASVRLVTALALGFLVYVVAQLRPTADTDHALLSLPITVLGLLCWSMGRIWIDQRRNRAIVSDISS